MSQPTVTFSAQGTRFLVRIAGVFTDINQLTGINGPDVQDNIENTSTLSSPGGFEETQPLMKKWTPLTGTLQWNPADAVHKYLQDSKMKYPAPLERFMEIASDPNQETVLFSGYVTKFARKLQGNATGKIDLEVTPTGEPTIYYGISPA